MYAFIIYVQCNLKMDGSEQKYRYNWYTFQRFNFCYEHLKKFKKSHDAWLKEKENPNFKKNELLYWISVS